MEDSGSAEVMARAIISKLGARRAILAVVLSCAVMTYGGVSLFVVAFAVYPIAAALFKQADIPKRLIPATIALGAFTFTMTALPGTPAIQNAIPMPFFGTSPFAAPGLGVITALAMFTLGMLWLDFRARRLASEGYGEHPDIPPTPGKDLREHAAGEGFDLMELPVEQRPAEPPGVFVAVLPLALVIALNLLFTFVVIPNMDTGFLALPIYGETSVEQVGGIWSVIAALVFSVLVVIACNRKRLPQITRSVDDGANASLLPIFNTASLVGFGAVIASLAAFQLIRDAVVGLGGSNPLISLAIAVNVLAGMTGSASGGMSIALSTLGDTYLAMARPGHRPRTAASGDRGRHGGSRHPAAQRCRDHPAGHLRPHSSPGLFRHGHGGHADAVSRADPVDHPGHPVRQFLSPDGFLKGHPPPKITDSGSGGGTKPPASFGAGGMLKKQPEAPAGQAPETPGSLLTPYGKEIERCRYRR